MKNQMIDENPLTTTIPSKLQATQEWFACVITQKLVENQYINPTAPSGMLIAEEAARYIIPSPTLRPHQRIQIYNQQYWWRLLNTLHDNFPLLTRLFGYQSFNDDIGVPYLIKYPPNHWSLNFLGERLPKWISEAYHEPDQSLIFNAAQLDWAFMASFLSPQKNPLDLTLILQEGPNALLKYPFYLQPHIQLFKWDYDLLTFREAFLKQSVNHWLDHPFPSLSKEKAYYFVLYRSAKNNILYKEMSLGEYTLLSLLKKGSTIEAACEALEQQESAVYDQAATSLQQWLQDWTAKHWLTLESPLSPKL